MGTKLSDSAKRVQDSLSEKGFSFDVKELPGSTMTAQEAADSIGCTVRLLNRLFSKRRKRIDLFSSLHRDQIGLM